MRLTRWLLLAFILFSIAWVLFLPIRWLGAAVALVAGIALIVSIVRLRRKDFIRFEVLSSPAIVPAPLDPSDKIAIYATGQFTVDGQHQRFTGLPGFARTFASGEHALLCLLRDRMFAGIARWPTLEIGMWYNFFKPEEIRSVRYGALHFAGEPGPAIAVDYRLTIPAGSGATRTKILDETVYLVCADDADIPALLADLQYGMVPQDLGTV